MEQTDMMTVPLYGRKAAGRVALVTDEDYDLVMQFRWNVYEAERPSGRVNGPYARTVYTRAGKRITLKMHQLITGYPQTDHIDHDGLNNQRQNLRPATTSQNAANARPRSGTSRYRGVAWNKAQRKWTATRNVNGVSKFLGYFESEVEAAQVADRAAIAEYGEYANLNFPDGRVADEATRLQEWQAHEARRIAIQAEALKHAPMSQTEWWAQRELETRICVECGSPYESRSTNRSMYCGMPCNMRAYRRRLRNRAAKSGGTH
jgi:hypothetical protein